MILGREPVRFELGDRVDGLTAGHAHLDRSQVVEVARHRRLGGDDAFPGQQLDQLRLAGHRVLSSSRLIGAGAGPWCSRTDPGEEGEHGPRGMEPVVSLPHTATARTVDHLGGDLVAAMGRQAVQEDRVRAAAPAISVSSTLEPLERPPPGVASPSWPIDTQTSV